MGKFIAEIKGARVSGRVKYTPAHTKLGTGKQVSQMAVIPTIVNNDPYINDGGTLVEGGKVLLFITVWGAMADTIAKYLSEGKEFSCSCNVNSFESKIKDPATHQIILNAAGQPAITIKHGYTMIPSSFSFGNDSANQIQKEQRPLGWDGKMSLSEIEQALAVGTLGDKLAQAKQGPAIWETLRASLKTLTYQPGMTEFGKALVVPPEGAAPNAYTLAQQIAAATATPTVDGFTYEQMKAANWTDEQLLTAHGGKFASLVPKKAPAPPAAPPAPAMPPAPEEVIDTPAMEMTAGEGTAAAV